MSVPGTIVPSGPLVVADNSTPSFLVTPSPGWALNAVKVDGLPVPLINNFDGTYTYIFPSVHANHALVAVFSLLPPA